MTKEMSPAFSNANLPANIAGLGQALVQEGAASGGGFGDLLRFAARDGGIWVFGADAVEVEEGSQWAINPASFQRGYVCWKDKKPVGEAMVAVGSPAIDRTQLDDHGLDGEGKQTTWDEQMSVQLKCINGEDEGTQLEYKMSTYGGIASIKALMKQVGAQIQGGNDKIVAVVSLSNEHYQHKTHGKTYTPLMKVVDWMSMSGEDTSAEGSDEDGGSEVEKPSAAEEAGPEAKPSRRQRRK